MTSTTTNSTANTNNSNNSALGQYVNLFTTKAYVFYVNPENRSSWIQAAKKAIDVSILGKVQHNNNQNEQNSGQSPLRQELRLIAHDDETDETVFDDNITRTTFDQRSLKFCQWVDSKKLLWGLGFDQEGPLEEFIRNVKLAQQQQHHHHNQQQQQQPQQQHHHQQQQQQQSEQKHEEPQVVPKSNKLKQAPIDATTNPNWLEQELKNLRTNNLKLTQALQESKANVEQWQIELATLQKENKELKMRIMSVEQSNANNEQKNDLIEYKKYVEELQKEMSLKDKDIEKLQVSMEELALSKKESEDQLNNNSTIRHRNKESLSNLRMRIDTYISGLTSVSQDLKEFIDYTSR